MFFRKNKQNGFTLIELLVTMGILVVFLVGGIPAFRNYRYKVELADEIAKYQGMVYEAKSMSQAPEVNDSENVIAYVAGLNVEQNEYFIATIDDSDIDCTNVSEMNLIQENTFDENIEVSTNTKQQVLVLFSTEKQGKIIKTCNLEDINFQHSGLDNSNKKNKKSIGINKITGQVFINDENE